MAAQLDRGAQRRLTLVSAPAGFGKTTLVSAWARESQHAVAWLSLDEADSDPHRFLTYLISAIQRLESHFGAGLLNRLLDSPRVSANHLLTPLLNEIATIERPFSVVLDDYQVIDASPVDDILTFLLAHSPQPLHLLILTREDPPLPLPRLRVRNQLMELRAAELRFTAEEAATFLGNVMALKLSAPAVAALEARTEGWIAGLQLAALAMQGRTDHDQFVEAFAGSHRFILDYLLEEVLQRQPPDLRRFLLQSSILNRLSGPLCAAVTEVTESSAILHRLERDNVFVVPLDDERRWYRYHHLFADALRAQLLQRYPDDLPTLHQRAAHWYEAQGVVAEAIHHAVAAEDWHHAADQIERAWPAVDSRATYTEWLTWVQALPDAMIRTRPVLSANYGWALMNVGDLEASQPRFRDAERGSEKRRSQPSEDAIVADEEQFRALPATLAAAHAFYAQAVGDLAGTIRHARQVLEWAPEENDPRRGQAMMLLTLAHWSRGELAVAKTICDGFMSITKRVDNGSEAISAGFVWAEIKGALGQLDEAWHGYHDLLRLASRMGDPPPLGTQDLHRGLSDLYRERGDFAAANRHLQESKVLGEAAELPDWQRRLCLTEAALRQSEGKVKEAEALLDEAERHAIRTPIPDLQPIPAIRARLWLAQGRLPEALRWAQKQHLSAEDALSYPREFEHFTLARLLIAHAPQIGDRSTLHDAIALLARLYDAASDGMRVKSQIEAQMLLALALQAQGRLPAALGRLAAALALAAPEGFARLFLDEGPPMVTLLKEGSKREIAPAYLPQLLALVGETAAPPVQTQPLVESLTARELEVLRFLATEMSGPEIASELVISMNTMRTHSKRIYSKLGVGSRRAAVNRATAIGLL